MKQRTSELREEGLRLLSCFEASDANKLDSLILDDLKIVLNLPSQAIWKYELLMRRTVEFTEQPAHHFYRHIALAVAPVQFCG